LAHTIDSALERLLASLARLKVLSVADLQPGLVAEAIDRLSEGLPYSLPTELRSLYEWRNGSRPATGRNQLFPGGGFVPLRDAVVSYQGFREGAERAANGTDTNPAEIYDPRWFPVFLSYGTDYHIVMCGADPAAGSVWEMSLEDAFDRQEAAGSLSDFIDTITNRWELGAYYFDVDSGPLSDWAALAAERRAKNPIRVDVAALVDSLAADDPQARAEALRSFKNFLYPEAGPLLAALLHHPDRRARASAASLLGQMGDPSFLAALISALDDREYSVREAAKWGISNLQRQQRRRRTV
jgi:cell wall assembly regulator SMI1